MQKIRLRAIEPEDLDLLYTIENDRELWDIGTTNVPYSRFTLSEYITSTQNDIYADRQLRLMVENSDGEVIGITDLIDYDPQHNRAEVGIVIMKEWRRQGFATETLSAIKKYARHTIHIHKLYAIIDQGNEAATRLFTKAGFTEEAILYDWLYNGKSYRNAQMLSYSENT